jgi:hypothetical protein
LSAADRRLLERLAGDDLRAEVMSKIYEKLAPGGAVPAFTNWVYARAAASDRDGEQFLDHLGQYGGHEVLRAVILDSRFDGLPATYVVRLEQVLVTRYQPPADQMRRMGDLVLVLAPRPGVPAKPPPGALKELRELMRRNVDSIR